MADDTPNTEQTENTDATEQANLSIAEKVELVRTALREVLDPEIGLNVVELGLIKDIQVEDDKAHVIMIMTTPFCPYAPALLEAARVKTQETLGVPTTIEMGMDVWDPSMAEDGVLGEWGLF